MQKPSASGISLVLVAIMALSLGACTRHEEPAPAAAPIAAQPLPPPAPPPPPHPSADDQLQQHLAELGATPSNVGWTITLKSAQFGHGKVSFAADDEATLTKIANLLKDNSHLRLQIEDYTVKQGPKARLEEISQMRANAVSRDLTAKGGDQGRIQAEGRVDRSESPGIEIIFSNAEGDFPQPPVENS